MVKMASIPPAAPNRWPVADFVEVMATGCEAGVTVDEIDHINAHATSTQVGDKGELAAIKTLFPEW
jgi:hypothetical protein